VDIRIRSIERPESGQFWEHNYLDGAAVGSDHHYQQGIPARFERIPDGQRAY
jgi:hypothetical protein